MYSCCDFYRYVEIEVPGTRRRKLPSHLSKDYLMPKRVRRDSDPDYIPPTGTAAQGASAEHDEEEDDIINEANITQGIVVYVLPLLRYVYMNSFCRPHKQIFTSLLRDRDIVLLSSLVASLKLKSGCNRISGKTTGFFTFLIAFQPILEAES